MIVDRQSKALCSAANTLDSICVGTKFDTKKILLRFWMVSRYLGGVLPYLDKRHIHITGISLRDRLKDHSCAIEISLELYV